MKFENFLGLFHQVDEIAKSHVRNLIALSIVDGKFKPVEYDLVESIAKKYHISESELLDIFRNSESGEFEVPADKRAGFYQLYDLVHMMIIDKVVHEEEFKFCNLFAIKLGYSKTHAKELIDGIVSNITHGQNHEEAMNRLSLLLSGK